MNRNEEKWKQFVDKSSDYTFHQIKLAEVTKRDDDAVEFLVTVTYPDGNEYSQVVQRGMLGTVVEHLKWLRRRGVCKELVLDPEVEDFLKSAREAQQKQVLPQTPSAIMAEIMLKDPNDYLLVTNDKKLINENPCKVWEDFVNRCAITYMGKKYVHKESFSNEILFGKLRYVDKTLLPVTKTDIETSSFNLFSSVFLCSVNGVDNVIRTTERFDNVSVGKVLKRSGDFQRELEKDYDEKKETERQESEEMKKTEITKRPDVVPPAQYYKHKLDESENILKNFGKGRENPDGAARAYDMYVKNI